MLNSLCQTHAYTFEILYLNCGVNGQPGVTWGHGGQILIFKTELS